MGSPVFLPQVQEPRRIGVFMFRQIGDVLLLTSALRALHERFPEARITAVVNDFTAPVLENNPDVHHIIRYARKARLGPFGRLNTEFGLGMAVRGGRFDLTLDFTGGDRPAFLSYFSRAPRRVAFEPPSDAARWKRRAYTDFVPRPARQIHQVERQMLMLAPLGIQTTPPPLRLRLRDEEIAWARARQAGIGHKTALVHFASNWLFKCWEDAKAAALIDWLANERGFKVWFTCGPAEREIGYSKRVLELCRTKPQVHFGDLTLRQLAAMAAVSSVFVGADTAPMHIAAAVGIPTVGIFGPTYSQIWRPWSDKSLVVRQGCPCQELGGERCDWSTTRACLKAVTVENVQDAVSKLLHN